MAEEKKTTLTTVKKETMFLCLNSALVDFWAKNGRPDKEVQIELLERMLNWYKKMGTVTLDEQESSDKSGQLKTTLEEAAHSYSESDEPLYSPGHRFHWDSDSLFGKQIETTFKAGAEWQKEKDTGYGNVILSEEDFDAEKEKAGEWGYNLCKQQMMKEAVEGVVEWDNDSKELFVLIILGNEFKEGQKVKIIIVPQKED